MIKSWAFTRVMHMGVSAEHNKPHIRWYRSPVGRDDLRDLNQKNNFLGAVQTVGYLGVLAATGTSAYLAAGRLHWSLVVLLVFVHGTCCAFLPNGFHELIHDSVFTGRRANRYFLWVYSFLGWLNHIYFWASHTEHHKYTLHPPDDQEVVFPVKLTLGAFLTRAIVFPSGFYNRMKMNLRLCFGRLCGDWEKMLFCEVVPERKQQLFNWERFLLLGHGGIVVVSIIYELWMLPVVITLAPFYGGGLQFLCNAAQHTGLRDNVPDYRLCCRTIILNPVFRFLYWHMNYHTEHHMYAAVPCYHLGRLHKLIKHDLPHCPRGLIETWVHIIGVLRRQKREPDYQFTAELPAAVEAASAATAT